MAQSVAPEQNTGLFTAFRQDSPVSPIAAIEKMLWLRVPVLRQIFNKNCTNHGGPTVKLRIAIALTLAFLPAGTAFADSINFTGTNTVLGHSFVYGSGPDTVTAYAFANSGNSLDLYGKNGGATENGVGIAGQPDNEITDSTFIQLNLSNITSPFSLSIGSTQNTEWFNVCFSNVLGTVGSNCTEFADPGSNPFATPNFTRPGGDQYVSIEATGGGNSVPGAGNVLLDGLTTTPAVTPEPSSLLLLGTGIVGAAFLLRRRMTALPIHS